MKSDEGEMSLQIGQVYHQFRISGEVEQILAQCFPISEEQQEVGISSFFYSMLFREVTTHPVISELFLEAVGSIEIDENWRRKAVGQPSSIWALSDGLEQVFKDAQDIAMRSGSPDREIHLDELLFAIFTTTQPAAVQGSQLLLDRAGLSRSQVQLRFVQHIREAVDDAKRRQLWESEFKRRTVGESAERYPRSVKSGAPAAKRRAAAKTALPPGRPDAGPGPGQREEAAGHDSPVEAARADLAEPRPAPPSSALRSPSPPPAGQPTPTPPPPPTPGQPSPSPPTPPPSPPPPSKPVETYTEFVTDNAEIEVDTLDRGALAISLARQLHRIWRKSNGLDAAPAGGVRSNEGGAFVLHLDAPWGGGKTTFAHFVSRVLNPYAAPSRNPPAFLAERYGKTFNFADLFLERGWRSDSRRPWITVWFNAWQAEDSRPPWWVFYQTIRKGCFDAIREEGDEPLDVGRKAKAPPLVPPDWERHESWRGLMWREYAWRLGDPKVMALLLTALISILAATLLWATGAIGPGDKGGVSIVTSNIPGFVLATITGISALWGLGALVTESVVPGTNSLAERLSLGSMDPFQRFRDHFARTMEAVRRPVMVIVDDLDRCKPEFIVDLLRGIQILLRSPRVVFVILGDREWIERAFEHHHEALSKVNVGPEQSLGARFVEKTIQMSFILPGMKHKQTAYVRRILLGAVEGLAKKPGRGAPKMAVQVRDAVKQVTSTARHAVLDSEGLRSEVRKEIARRSKDAHSTAGPDPLLSQTIDEEVAIHVSADESAEREIVHLLQRLAPYFPSNPRQIKRIINAMTTYTSVAIGVAPDKLNVDRLTQLAIWVTLMTEWPETWRLLASCPEMADVISAGDAAEARLDALGPGILPGSREATLMEVRRIGHDPSLRGLIIGEGREGPRLDTAAIRELVDLTPLYRGRRRLAEPAEKAPPASPPPPARRRTSKKKPPAASSAPPPPRPRQP